MHLLPEEKLLSLNQIGFIPGPHEEEQAFIKRVDYGLNLKDHLPEELKNNLSDETYLHPEISTPAIENLKKIYDCAPTWTPLFFSNYKLPFWHGGCAWIFQMTENSPTSALIQLKESFKTSPQYLGIYQREELLTHELSHVGRMMFQEPKFEELLAYRTSKSSFRKWFGPSIQSSSESALFILTLFIVIVFDVFSLTLDNPQAYSYSLWLKMIPIGIVLAALIRLIKRHKTYLACVKNLEACVENNQAEAVAYRLQDEEILLFSKLTTKEIRDYASLMEKEELRWKVISKAYFNS